MDYDDGVEYVYWLGWSMYTFGRSMHYIPSCHIPFSYFVCSGYTYQTGRRDDRDSNLVVFHMITIITIYTMEMYIIGSQTDYVMHIASYIMCMYILV